MKNESRYEYSINIPSRLNIYFKFKVQIPTGFLQTKTALYYTKFKTLKISIWAISKYHAVEKIKEHYKGVKIIKLLKVKEQRQSEY